MEIEGLSLRRFRGFDRETTIPLSRFTVLTGPNNLGKSTVLRALGVFFQALQPDRIRFSRDRQRYRYSEDYPKKYEGRAGRRWTSRMRARLRFSDEDLRSAASEDVQLNTPTQVIVEFPLEGDPLQRSPECRVGDLEPWETLHFRQWFSSHFRYVYIPATRNVEDFKRSVFYELVEGAIRDVNQSRRRIDAIQRFYDDVRQSISGVEATLTHELQEFLPDIRGIEFLMGELDLSRLVSVRDVEVDDVAKTSLSQKGDGFKSLFAMSVLQYIARRRHGQNLLFGIEEPEAHLHSGAIYGVKTALRELAQRFQLIITTHSPILIQRDDLHSNIVIEALEAEDFAAVATPAESLAAIRASLGIQPQDNMTTAEVVVVVEGATEERCLGALLSAFHPSFAAAYAEGRVRVIGSGGASKAAAMIRALARDAANCVVLFDHDEAGSQARDKLRTSGLIDVADILQVPQREGCQETEFEDVFSPDIWARAVAVACGIDSSADEFREYQRRSGNGHTRYAKWANVMSRLFEAHGRDWEQFADASKLAVADSLIQHSNELDPGGFPWLRSMADRVVQYLNVE